MSQQVQVKPPPLEAFEEPSNLSDSYDPLSLKSRKAFARAISSGNLEEVLWYLKMGVDLNNRFYNGLTPLMLAFKSGKPLIAHELMKNKTKVSVKVGKFSSNFFGVNTSIRSYDQFEISSVHFMPLLTPLTENLLEFLSHQTTDVNVLDKEGWTPLMHSISNQNTQAVYALLCNCKTDLSLTNYDSISTLELANFFKVKNPCQESDLIKKDVTFACHADYLISKAN